jgi:hypothetical protein
MNKEKVVERIENIVSEVQAKILLIELLEELIHSNNFSEKESAEKICNELWENVFALDLQKNNFEKEYLTKTDKKRFGFID